MADKIYLDDQGNPLVQKVYLDENGNPIAKTAQPASSTPQPSMVDSLLADNPAAPWDVRAGQYIARLAKAHPVQAGATIGGALASGGSSLLPQLGLAALGAAGGAGYGLLAKGAQTGDYGTPAGNAETMAKEGAASALGQAGGALASKGLQLAGRGLYRVALAPTQQVLGKYGDVVGEGLETATPVSKSGLVKAVATKATRMANKANVLSAADQNVGYAAAPIADDASKTLSDYAAKQVRAGLPNPTNDFADRLAQFKAANPNGSLTPTSLDQIQGTLNDEAGGAFRKLRMREPLSTQDKGTVDLLSAIKRTQEAGVPGITDLNRGVMDAEGLRRAIERRTLGSGGNQGLDTLLAVMKGAGGIPARVAMMPPVMSGAGIAANTAAPAAPTLLRSLMTALGYQEPPQ